MTNLAPTRFLALLTLMLALLVAACASGNDDDEQPLVNTPQPPPADVVSDNALKISVVQDGIYRLTLSDLEQAGLDIDTLSAETMALSNMDQPIPFLLQGDALIFYGESSNSRYSRINPYILRTGEAESGTLMTTVSSGDSETTVASVQQSVRVERNWQYEQRAADAVLQEGQERDTWFWRRISNVGDDAVHDFSFELPSIADGSAELRMNFWGLTHIPDVDQDHDFELYVNDELVTQITFDGQVFHTSETTIPVDLLQEGRNAFRIDNSAPGNAFIDQFLFNYAELSFPAQTAAVNNRLSFSGVEGSVTISDLGADSVVLDITNPAAPMQITDVAVEGDAVTVGVSAEMAIATAGENGYLDAVSIVPLIETDLRAETNQADLLIVTTRELSPELDPLITARLDQGLTVKVTHVDELYDEFAAGAITPDAIQNFVTYAHENWASPAPSYLFLIGDATIDMLGNGATIPDDPVSPPRNLVPSPIVEVSHAGETVADARLADVDGDLKPDLAVGRWPVDTAREVRNLVTRTLAYEEGTASERALFTYDGSSTEFSSFTERLIEQSELPEAQAELFAGPTSDEVTAQWNDGAWLVSYVGHGSLNLWGADEVLTQEAVADIDSGDNTPPIVVQFSCLTGHFGHWQSDSISESMLVQDNGPVLLVASTSLTLSSHQSPFAIAFLAGLQNPEYERIGDALQSAKADLQTEGNAGLQEISDTFGLIGDPSAIIARPELASAN